MRDNEKAAAILGAILIMSDEAERQGGARSIAGVAALHRMQSTIQKNRARIREMVAGLAEPKP